MIITKKTTTHSALNIDGNTISEVSKTKCLDVYMDNKLHWKKHINDIAGKLSRGMWRFGSKSTQTIEFRGIY